jgi:DUF1680 family protein
MQWGAAAAAGICAAHGVPAWPGTKQDYPFNAMPLSEFGYGQVAFEHGPLQRQFEENHQLLLNMNEDSLLRPFRVREGLPAPGTEMGGWYSTNGSAPACPYGQWLSALARMYAVTRDQPTYDKIDRMIRGYSATLELAGKFYESYRFPAYTYDKLSIGLTDARVYASHPLALDVLAHATDAVLPYLPPKAIPHKDPPLPGGTDDESYTMPENLFLAWQRTGDKRYYDLAQRFIYHEYFDPLARGENALPGRHAYSHVNALSSAATAYLALGDSKYFHAAKNGFAMVQEQSYATGGWGPDEHFIWPGKGQLGESLTTLHDSFETPCGAYAHFKIARYLLRITGDASYGDSMEQVLYNTVLGAKPIQPDGSSFYYSDYTFNGSKTYFRDKWPCCSGTLPQIAADYHISAYFKGARGVYVNLYVPSTLHWKEAGAQFALRQVTGYPYDSHIRLDMTGSSAATFSVFLRIPEWARGASLEVNGMRESQKPAPGSFAEIRRQWKTGDRIELELPFARRLKSVDEQHPDTVALLSGPLVLMALRENGQDPVQDEEIDRAVLLSAQQNSAGAHEWVAGAGAGTVRLKPFLDIQDEAYTTYLKVVPV